MNATNNNPVDGAVRKPHAVRGFESRRLKAMKIERLLDMHERAQPMRLLEIGTGSGGIAHYFATHPNLRIDVDAVDVVDGRSVHDGYRFQLVSGTDLPFTDGIFDIVLTNHVIEHVGDRRAQLAHLLEIRRVMRRDGAGYLAVPNRWQIVEPHYRLPFLSWWPHGWRSAYLKRLRGVDFYDCEPLQLHELESLFTESGFVFRNLCVESLHAMLAIEYPRSITKKMIDAVPDSLLSLLRPLIPTLIYKFSL